MVTDLDIGLTQIELYHDHIDINTVGNTLQHRLRKIGKKIFFR